MYPAFGCYAATDKRVGNDMFIGCRIRFVVFVLMWLTLYAAAIK